MEGSLSPIEGTRVFAESKENLSLQRALRPRRDLQEATDTRKKTDENANSMSLQRYQGPELDGIGLEPVRLRDGAKGSAAGVRHVANGARAVKSEGVGV